MNVTHTNGNLQQDNPRKITGRRLTISKTTNLHTVSVLNDKT